MTTIGRANRPWTSLKFEWFRMNKPVSRPFKAVRPIWPFIRLSKRAMTLKNRDDAFFLVSEKALQSLLAYMNLKAPPFDELTVRQAFKYGIDYRQIAEDVSEGVFAEAKGLYPVGMPYTVENQVYNPKKAEEILDQAGWVKKKRRSEIQR